MIAKRERDITPVLGLGVLLPVQVQEVIDVSFSFSIKKAMTFGVPVEDATAFFLQEVVVT